MIPLAAAALSYAPEIAAGIGSVLVPSIMDALMTHGPTPEAKAKIQSMLQAEAMKRAQAQGIPVAQAMKDVEAELGPKLEEAFSEKPGLMGQIMTWGLGAVAGGVAGHKLGSMVGGKAAKARIEAPGRKAAMADIAPELDQARQIQAGATGMSSPLPQRDRPLGKRSVGEDFESAAGDYPEAQTSVDVDAWLRSQSTAPTAKLRAGPGASPAPMSTPAQPVAPGAAKPGASADDLVKQALGLAERVDTGDLPMEGLSADTPAMPQLTFNLRSRRPTP